MTDTKLDPKEKIVEVMAALDDKDMFVVVNSHQDAVPYDVFADEFMHELMSGGDWHICHHPHKGSSSGY